MKKDPMLKKIHARKRLAEKRIRADVAKQLREKELGEEFIKLGVEAYMEYRSKRDEWCREVLFHGLSSLSHQEAQDLTLEEPANVKWLKKS